MPNHVHCLFLLNPQKSIAEVIKQIKDSTSHHVNQNNLIPKKFAWQTGYAAYSVSESGVEKVYQYIIWSLIYKWYQNLGLSHLIQRICVIISWIPCKNQKEHHRRKSFQQEYETFLKLYGLDER